MSVNGSFLSSPLDNLIEPDPKKIEKPAFIVVHGAGSFGHHTAKQYGLRGKTSPPPPDMQLPKSEQKGLITGLAKTRHR